MKKPPIMSRRPFKTKYKLNEQYKHTDFYNFFTIFFTKKSKNSKKTKKTINKKSKNTKKIQYKTKNG